jgi:micrococcal nuclease
MDGGDAAIGFAEHDDLLIANLAADHRLIELRGSRTFNEMVYQMPRIANIEAPEMPGSPKCERGRNGWCDYRLAVQSRDALQGLLASGPATINRQGQDAYGRTLARVAVNGQDAGRYLVSLGLARPWR